MNVLVIILFLAAWPFLVLAASPEGVDQSRENQINAQEETDQASPSSSTGVDDQLEAQAEQGSDRAKKMLENQKKLPVTVEEAQSYQPKKPAATKPRPLPPAVSAPKPTSSKVIRLEKVTVRERDYGVRLFIAMSEPVPFFSFFRKSPPSVFVQFLSTPVYAQGGPVENIGLGPVDQIAYGYEGVVEPGRLSAPVPIKYLEIRLNKPVVHYGEQTGSLIAINLVEAAAGEAAPGAETSFQSPDYKGELSLPERPVLDDFLRVAQGNNRNVILAREGARLARFQVFEAVRPLFPSATLRASRTSGDDVNPFASGVTGTSATTGFKRDEFGVQMGQPIYQSGRIWAAYKRARLNQEVAEELIRRQVGDVSFELRRAYYDALKTQAMHRLHRELLARAEQVRDLTLKKKALKLTSQVDALNVESQYNQAAYLVSADEQEVALSRLNLSAVLNQPQALPEVIPGKLSARNIQLNIDSLLLWAQSNRPDLRIAKRNVDLALQSWKIAKGEDGLRVDVSGFLGRAGATFSDEDLNLSTAWNFGVRASKPFGGNTLSVNHTDEKTAPDLSQAFVSQVHQNSVNLGILDALPGRSKSEQARLNYEKAKADHAETLQRAEYEVRDAFFNLQKLSHQMKSAQQDVEFRKKQLAVTRERTNLGLVENAQLLGDEIAFIQAQVSLIEAMAASETAMAALDKAVGMRLAR